MMLEPIKTHEEAFGIACDFISRGERRVEIVKKLRDDDMMGLECAETVELERLTHADATDGLRLAKWIVEEESRNGRE